MLQRALDQQLAQFGHLLDGQEYAALGAVQLKGQAASQGVEGREGFAGVDQQGFGVLVWVDGEEIG